MLSPIHTLALCTLPFLAACGGTNPVQPKDMTAGMAAGEALKCDAQSLAEEAMTFVVDWKDGQRASLESAMGKGVAVIKYSCDGVKVLPACRVNGDYGYAGSTHRKKVINMKDAVQAQAQFGGRHIGASFQGQFSQGRSLSLAYSTVGASSTTVTSVDKSMLSGRCNGATHFVYEAEVGAFAVATTSKGQASAFGEVFGQGSVSGASSAGKDAVTNDGSLAACKQANRKDTESVDECSAIVRISMLPIEASGGGKLAKAGVIDLRSCPAGFVFTDDECVPKASATNFLCSKGDYMQCFEQCSRGHTGSCGRLGLISIRSDDDVRQGSSNYGGHLKHWEANTAKVLPKLAKACLEAGETNACMGARNASLYQMSETYGFDKTEPAHLEAARLAQEFKYIEAGCRGGEGFACTALVAQVTKSKGKLLSPDAAAQIIDQACSRSTVACGVAGHLHSGVYGLRTWNGMGAGGAPSRDAAERAYTRACDGGLGDGCFALGFMHLPPARVKAGMAALAAQDMSSPTYTRAALAYSALGAPMHDAAKGMALLKRTCTMGEDANIDGDLEIACNFK